MRVVESHKLGRPGAMAWAIFFFFCLITAIAPARAVAAPSFDATLDRTTVAVGETATLSLSFEGGQPDTLPAVNQQPNLQVVAAGNSRNVSIVNGQMTSTLTQQYLLTPMQPGTFTIPALQVTINGTRLSSPELKLHAVRATGSAGDTNQPLAFMRIFVPRKEVYTGESIAVELQVLVREGVLNAEDILRAFDAYTGTPIVTEGSRVLRTAHANRRRGQFGGANYNVSTLVTAISPVKTGTMTIKSIEVPLTVQLPIRGQRRRDVFDPFGMFQQAQEYKIVLNAEPEQLSVASLPTEGRPADFNGAVGSFTLAMEAGPTNVAAGDPVTVRIRIEGTGDLESVSLPEPSGWKDFKTYPPTSKIESQDPLQLNGAKIFEQVVVPQTPETKALPGVTFSFFDPDRKSYRTLKHADLPLIVRPGGTTPPPAVATPRQAEEENAPATPDIVPVKRRLGDGSGPGTPLVQRPWFLGLQFIPVALLIGAVLYRKRLDNEARNPRIGRRRQVERTIRLGLAELRQLATQNKSDEFFSTLFRLLQERISERLDVPSSSITEAVIEERLRPAGVADELLSRAGELFQSCNLARFAPAQSSQELQALVPKAEGVFAELGKLEI